MKKEKDSKRTITVAHPAYQPSKAEKEEDMRPKSGTFEDLVKSVVSPVKVRYTKKPKWRK